MSHFHENTGFENLIEHQLNVHITILKRKSPVLNSVLSGERRNCFIQIEHIIISSVSLSRWVDCVDKLVLTHGDVECKLKHFIALAGTFSILNLSSSSRSKLVFTKILSSKTRIEHQPHIHHYFNTKVISTEISVIGQNDELFLPDWIGNNLNCEFVKMSRLCGQISINFKEMLNVSISLLLTERSFSKFILIFRANWYAADIIFINGTRFISR